MATNAHVITLPEDAYEMLRREAARRGVEPDVLAEQLLRADLGPAEGWGDLEETLRTLADMRAQLPEIDGVDLARQVRADLEARGA